ncbi:GABA transporter 1 [Glycine soja]|uniref:GABA transporter 1 n=1 Tax=Glycine soja TaxID=3848 RepID=A0A445ID91_GLYSO|nr:GABA transporter 1 [Glycine soja]
MLLNNFTIEKMQSLSLSSNQKAIYLLLNPNGTMKIYEFVVIFGCFTLILAQMPSFHSLRHLNLVSLVMCLSYSACATAASIYIGKSSNGPEKDYSLIGDTTNRLFGIFNAIPIIANTYGSGIVPEIQIGFSRSFAVITATTIAAMLPFFGDMNSLIGAFCYMPLDFILPVIFFNLTFKPSKRSSIFWLNSTIAIVFSTLGAMAAVSTVRQIILDAKTYQLFANV